MAANFLKQLLTGCQTSYLNCYAISGASTNENKFLYQWRKRGSNSLPDKVSGGTVLTILMFLNLMKDSIIVLRLINRVKSNDVTLTAYGMLVYKLCDYC